MTTTCPDSSRQCIRCPVCSETALRRCKCPLSDMVCEQGHHWHTCLVHNTTVLGKADHSLDMQRCRCKIGDTESGNTVVKLPTKDITPKFTGDRIV